MLETLPERTILMAVLERAILDACGGGDCTLEEATEAMEWLTDWDEVDCLCPFTFPWICEHLEIDPGHIKRVALEFKYGTEKQQAFAFIPPKTQPRKTMNCMRKTVLGVIEHEQTCPMGGEPYY